MYWKESKNIKFIYTTRRKQTWNNFNIMINELFIERDRALSHNGGTSTKWLNGVKESSVRHEIPFVMG